MQIKRLFRVTIVMVIMIAASMAATGCVRAGQSSVDVAASLAQKDWQADQVALGLLETRRGKLAHILIAELKSPKPATRSSAMYLLGLYRIRASVAELASDIQFHHFFRNDMLPVRGTSFRPAVTALIRIGSAAIPAMVKNLGSTTDVQVAGCSAWVIRKVEGRELGVCVIKLALHKAMSPLEKDRLRAALACVGSKDWKWDYWSPIVLPAVVKWPVGNLSQKGALKNK